MKINIKNSEFSSAVIHFILLNKLNNYGEKQSDGLNLYQYELSTLVAKINEWLLKNNHPYFIVIRLDNSKDGFAWTIEERGKLSTYKNVHTFNDATMYATDKLYQLLNKTKKSLIPEFIDPEYEQGEINAEVFG